MTTTSTTTKKQGGTTHQSTTRPTRVPFSDRQPGRMKRAWNKIKNGVKKVWNGIKRVWEKTPGVIKGALAFVGLVALIVVVHYLFIALAILVSIPFALVSAGVGYAAYMVSYHLLWALFIIGMIYGFAESSDFDVAVVPAT